MLLEMNAALSLANPLAHVGTLLASENVTRGDALVSAADGKYAKLAVRAMGGQGRVVGFRLGIKQRYN